MINQPPPGIGPGENPLLMLPDAKIAWCNRHLSAFRPDWPTGYLIISLVTAYQMMNDEKFQEACGGDLTQANGLLVEYSPLCCYLEAKGWPEWARLSIAGDIKALQRMGALYVPPPPEGQRV